MTASKNDRAAAPLPGSQAETISSNQHLQAEGSYLNTAFIFLRAFSEGFGSRRLLDCCI